MSGINTRAHKPIVAWLVTRLNHSRCNMSLGVQYAPTGIRQSSRHQYTPKMPPKASADCLSHGAHAQDCRPPAAQVLLLGPRGICMECHCLWRVTTLAPPRQPATHLWRTVVSSDLRPASVCTMLPPPSGGPCPWASYTCTGQKRQLCELSLGGSKHTTPGLT